MCLCLVHQPHRARVPAAPKGPVLLLLTCLWGHLRAQPRGREGEAPASGWSTAQPQGVCSLLFFQLRLHNSQDSTSERAQLGRAMQGPETGFGSGPETGFGPHQCCPQPGIEASAHPSVDPRVSHMLSCSAAGNGFGNRTNNHVGNNSAACFGQKTRVSR